MAINARHGRLSGGAGYTVLAATFQSPETVDGTGNSSNDAGNGLEGTIDIRPGDRIPLIPRHSLKAFAEVQATPKLAVDIDLMAASGVFARGNENNLDQAGGPYYLGPGTTPAYGIVNIGARYQIVKGFQLIAQINNVFDSHYYTASQLQPTGFTATGAFIARPFAAINGEFPLQQAAFYAPGAPTTYWVGTRVKF